MGGITPICCSLWVCAATVWSVIEIQVDSDQDVLAYDVDLVQTSLKLKQRVVGVLILTIPVLLQCTDIWIRSYIILLLQWNLIISR